MPDADHLVLGELETTLVQWAPRLPSAAALVHSDIGTGDPARNARLAGRIAGLLPPLLAPGAIVVSDQPLPSETLSRFPLPVGVAQGRYHLYRYATTSADRESSAIRCRRGKFLLG
jgi:hypothetical protein